MFSADLLERAAKSAGQAFVLAFCGSVIASVTPGVTWSVAWWQSVAVAATAAGAMAVGSAITSFISKPFGDRNSASILPVVPASIPVSLNTVLQGPGEYVRAARVYPSTLDAPLAPEEHQQVG